MSLEYDKYLTEHVQNVQKCIDWMYDKNIIQDNMYNIDLALDHDKSKWSQEEYVAYDDYFYGNINKTKKEIDNAFDYAWLHHIHNNPHHWQYWVLQGDEDAMKALEMPEQYVYEMVADWWSFSWTKNNLREIFTWWSKHKHMVILHPNTFILVNDILSNISIALEEDNILQTEKETKDEKNNT